MILAMSDVLAVGVMVPTGSISPNPAASKAIQIIELRTKTPNYLGI